MRFWGSALPVAVAWASVLACESTPQQEPSSSAGPVVETVPKTISVPGIRMRVPVDYVTLEGAPGEAPDPNIAAAEAPDGEHGGTLQVERLEEPAIGWGRTVRGALDREVAALRSRQDRDTNVEVKEKDNAVTLCSRSKADAAEPFRDCITSYVTPKHKVVSLTAVCLRADAAACDAALSSVELDPEERLPFDAKIPLPEAGQPREVAGPGVTASVPSNVEPADEEERQEVLRSLSAPDSVVDVAVLHAKEELPATSVELVRTVAPLPENLVGKTVAEALESLAASRKDAAGKGGAKVLSAEVKPKDNAMETCFVTSEPAPDGAGPEEHHVCALFYVDADRKGVFTEVRCTADAVWAPEICGAILASRKYEQGKRLPLKDKLAKPAGPPKK